MLLSDRARHTERSRSARADKRITSPSHLVYARNDAHPRILLNLAVIPMLHLSTTLLSDRAQTRTDEREQLTKPRASYLVCARHDSRTH
jgi:hypothetical protein